MMDFQPWLPLVLVFLLLPDPNPRKTAVRTGAQEPAPAGKSEREMSGFHGSVKTCIEENTFPNGYAYSTYLEFSADGKLVVSRSHNQDGSEWVTTNTYDADGRLTKITSGKSGDAPTQTLYTYDDHGRLLSVTYSDSKNRTEYSYDEKGRKTEVTRFDPKLWEHEGNVGYSGTPWEATLMGFGVPVGGTVLTLYDDDRATELQVRDAEDHLVSRVVRTYNAAGLVVREQPILESSAPVLDKFPAEMRSQLNDAQMQSMTAMMRGLYERTTLFSYDDHGRVTTQSELGGLIQKAEMTSYNDHGDIAEQRTTMISPMAMGTEYSMGENGALIPDKPSGPSANVTFDTDVHYAYQYDQYGNWTQQTMTDAKRPEAPPSVRRRTLTYY